MSAAELHSEPVRCFSVFAAPEACVVSRVIDLFARQGFLPDRLDVAVLGRGDEGMVIDLQVAGLAAERAHHIVARLTSVVGVARVLTADKRAAQAAGALR